LIVNTGIIDREHDYYASWTPKLSSWTPLLWPWTP